MGKNDRCAVWGCGNGRRYLDSYVIKTTYFKMGSIFANAFFLSKE